MRWVRTFLFAWILLVISMLSIDREIVAPVVDSESSANNCLAIADTNVEKYELWPEPLDGELDR